ncbi:MULTISPECIES: dienelactone hydrolase family protein [Sphingobium]|uniref:dienelactone hydrolase family protein n=1 Tax=Sphingobium TaxID=165695 RepID=UPI0015EB523F|nr:MULTISPECIES: dienelactone hydrolase family protein [Sphingobium]MCW2362507.1 carboxymethylenebutenolidase [Sphingobium sp. B10D3B]MCW2400813.1 carboxymethylenebutenolidase [Sphingobium sp. B10D7B]MCW2407792.1 carboxymethylenebutenolidase [Sphingobium xanthum]
MCDNDIHQGLVEDWSVTRRMFMATGAAVGLAGAATAQAVANVTEKNVTIKTPDGSADAALFHPAGTGPWPAVLMWPDIMGLRPVFREMGRRLAAEGYVVLVPNPFYRNAVAPVIDGTFDFSNPESRKILFGYRAAMSDAAVDHDAAAYLGFLDAQPQVDKDRKAGVQGYCMGGPLSFRTAAVASARIGAVGSFHGGGLTTDQPSSPHLLIPKTDAAYLVAVAQNDDAKEPESKTILRKAFDAAGKTATVEVYPADHGWCVPGSQAYNHDAAEKAWAALLAMYRTALA